MKHQKVMFLQRFKNAVHLNKVKAGPGRNQEAIAPGFTIFLKYDLVPEFTRPKAFLPSLNQKLTKILYLAELVYCGGGLLPPPANLFTAFYVEIQFFLW